MAAVAQNMQLRISSLHDNILHSYASAPSADATRLLIENYTAQSTDIAADTEIAFRRALEVIMTSSPDLKQNVTALIQYSISLATSFTTLAKIPYLLIEDLFYCQTISSAQEMWSIIESLVDALTVPELFAKGKFVILRTCNSLLRRLSKTCHTEFCGRVLMFLAAIYPLTERSAVNLVGKINASNVTSFEDTPPENEVAEAPQEDKMELDEEPHMSFDYTLYKTFWEIQSYFLLDNKALESQQLWQQILTSSGIILDTFEANRFSQTDIEHGRLKLHEQRIHSVEQSVDEMEVDQSHDGLDEATYMGCKYLTSSQLFTLQLHDAALRQQILTQILITIHYYFCFKASSPPAASVITTNAAAAAATAKLEEDLKQLQSRAYAVMKDTPPYGKHYADTLMHLLEREEFWITWKLNHCPNFEREHVSLELPKEVRKRKRAKNENIYAPFVLDHKNIQLAAKKIVESVPTFDKHIEADDPEAGIEDAYHPKHDTATRLLAVRKLSTFELMHDGNLSKLYPRAVKEEVTPPAEEGVEVDATEKETAESALDATEIENDVATTSRVRDGSSACNEEEDGEVTQEIQEEQMDVVEIDPVSEDNGVHESGEQ